MPAALPWMEAYFAIFVFSSVERDSIQLGAHFSPLFSNVVATSLLACRIAWEGTSLDNGPAGCSKGLLIDVLECFASSGEIFMNIWHDTLTLGFQNGLWPSLLVLMSATTKNEARSVVRLTSLVKQYAAEAMISCQTKKFPGMIVCT